MLMASIAIAVCWRNQARYADIGPHFSVQMQVRCADDALSRLDAAWSVERVILNRLARRLDTALSRFHAQRPVRVWGPPCA